MHIPRYLTIYSPTSAFGVFFFRRPLLALAYGTHAHVPLSYRPSVHLRSSLMACSLTLRAVVVVALVLEFEFENNTGVAYGRYLHIEMQMHNAPGTPT